MAEPKKDDIFDKVTGLADEIGLAGREKMTYIHEHMTRLGYEMIPSYKKKEETPDENDPIGNMFGKKKTKNPPADDEGDDSGNSGWRF